MVVRSCRDARYGGQLRPHHSESAPGATRDDLAVRSFTAEAVNWVRGLTDIPERPTDEGKRYVYAVKDVTRARAAIHARRSTDGAKTISLVP